MRRFKPWFGFQKSFEIFESFQISATFLLFYFTCSPPHQSGPEHFVAHFGLALPGRLKFHLGPIALAGPTMPSPIAQLAHAAHVDCLPPLTNAHRAASSRASHRRRSTPHCAPSLLRTSSHPTAFSTKQKTGAPSTPLPIVASTS
jgi:hypothetical protein